MAKAVFHPHAMSAEVIEALALLEALKMATSLSFMSVFVEGDAKSLISTMQFRSFNASHSNLILKDAARLAKSLQSYNFTFVWRACNWVAHDTARKDCHSYNKNSVLLCWL
jgi:ribonuclease HI